MKFLKALYKGGISISSDAIGAIKDIKETIEFNLEEKQSDLFAQAEEEYDNGEIDKGLWSQALVKAKGEENLRKVEYMKMRVKQLKKNKPNDEADLHKPPPIEAYTPTKREKLQ